MTTSIEELHKVLSLAIEQFFLQNYQLQTHSKERELINTRKEFEGELTSIIFPFCKKLKKKPQEIGHELGAALVQQYPDIIQAYSVANQGFLNLTLKDQVWLSIFKNLIDIEADSSVQPFTEKKQTILIEFSSPNANKPLHLGHLRNNFIGMSVSRILEAYGYSVRKICLVNDRGIHICKSMIAYQLYGHSEAPSPTCKGDLLVGNYYVLFDKYHKQQAAKSQTEETPIMEAAREMLRKWEQGDATVRSIWKKLRQWVLDAFAQTYQSIGVSFDKYYMESDTYLLGKGITLEYLKKGIFYKEKDGSIWVDLEKEGYDKKLLLRSDGTSVYMTQDIANAKLRWEEFHMHQSIYVVGNEQDYHFQILKEIIKKMGFDYAEYIKHLSYGMVHLPSGKMKSREGIVVDADDLIKEMIEVAQERTQALGKTNNLPKETNKILYHQLAMAALKFFILKVDAQKSILFDKEKSINFQGDTGIYIQYTYVKIKSILHLARLAKFYKDYPNLPTSELKLNTLERKLIGLICQYLQKVEQAAQQLSPSIIANYSLDLAKWMSKYYSETPILKEENPDVLRFRLCLIYQTAKRLRDSMYLLGIDMPERM